MISECGFRIVLTLRNESQQIRNHKSTFAEASVDKVRNDKEEGRKFVHPQQLIKLNSIHMLNINQRFKIFKNELL